MGIVFRTFFAVADSTFTLLITGISGSSEGRIASDCCWRSSCCYCWARRLFNSSVDVEMEVNGAGTIRRSRCSWGLTDWALDGESALIIFEIPFSFYWTVVVGTRMIWPSANSTTEKDFCCKGRFAVDSPAALTRTTLPLLLLNVDFDCKWGIRTMNVFAVCCAGLTIFVFRFSSVGFRCKRLNDFSDEHW